MPSLFQVGGYKVYFWSNENEIIPSIIDSYVFIEGSTDKVSPKLN